MNQIYPLKFFPIIHDKIWGGEKLKKILNKPALSDKAGESWEISGEEGSISIVSNGFLEGNSIEELIEVYMGDLVGDRIFEKYGLLFPLLIKFIDANDNLSIQVHPDDVLAAARHESFGKTEMWYILQAEKDAKLVVGFAHKTDKKIYLEHLANKSLLEILNTEIAKEGDVFFLPAGRVHAIGAGILLAEIQQTSDITYRIYDYDRKDANGNLRELHTDLALDAIKYDDYKDLRTNYDHETGIPVELIRCPYFTANYLRLAKPFERDLIALDCFVIYICIEGSCQIVYNNSDRIDLSKGETILMPAAIPHYSIVPDGQVQLLEVYIDHELKEESSN